MMEHTKWRLLTTINRLQVIFEPTGRGYRMTTTLKKPASGWNMQRGTTHPGEMLREEFLNPLGISQNALAMKIHVPATRIGEIIHGRRGMTSDTALRLARFFGNSAEFWMNLQMHYDLSKAKIELEKKINREVEVLARAS